MSAARDIVAEIRAVARDCGYALAVHGSQRRDLDLIAAPWTVEAVEPLTLVDTICSVVGLRPRVGNIDPKGRAMPNPEFKPYGRLAWSLASTNGRLGYEYIDLSVAPKAGTGLPMLVAEEYRRVEPAPPAPGEAPSEETGS